MCSSRLRKLNDGKDARSRAERRADVRLCMQVIRRRSASVGMGGGVGSLSASMVTWDAGSGMWDVGSVLGDDGSATGCATHRPPVELWDGGAPPLWEGAYLLVMLRFDKTTAQGIRDPADGARAEWRRVW